MKHLSILSVMIILVMTYAFAAAGQNPGSTPQPQTNSGSTNAVKVAAQGNPADEAPAPADKTSTG